MLIISLMISYINSPIKNLSVTWQMVECIDVHLKLSLLRDTQLIIEHVSLDAQIQ